MGGAVGWRLGGGGFVEKLVSFEVDGVGGVVEEESPCPQSVKGVGGSQGCPFGEGGESDVGF